MADLFKEIIPSILETKKDVLDNEKDYVPFLINRALSFHSDCLFYSNQMNMQYNLDKRLQYDYFMGSIRKTKRGFVPWSKPAKNETVNLVKWYFGYSTKKAYDAIKILSKENIDHIKQLHKSIEQT